jgi:hypothetical protein
MRWAGHIASTGEFRDKCKILARKELDSLENLSIDGYIIIIYFKGNKV